MHRSSIYIAFIILLATACQDRCERVDGPRERFEVPLEFISELELNTPAEVVVYDHENGEGSLEVIAQPDIYQALHTQLRNDRCKIDLEACFREQDPILIEARLSELRSIHLNAAGEIRSGELIDQDSLYITNSGLGDVDIHFSGHYLDARSSAAGNINLSGETDRLFTVVLGSGELNGFDLFADTVIIENYGSGVIEVHAADFLQVNFIENTTVRYRGNPKVITIAGEGELEDANLGI